MSDSKAYRASAPFHQEQALYNYGMYEDVQARITLIELEAQEKAGGHTRAQYALLTADTPAAFVYSQLCKNRTTYQTLTNMHATLAIMLTERQPMMVIPTPRPAWHEQDK